VPDSFRSQIGPSGVESIADKVWPNVFVDKALADLITVALHNNYDLQIAVARIKQAREIVTEVQSEGLPQIGYQAFAGGEKTIVAGQNNVTSTTYGTFGGLLSAAWEGDIWGRIRRSTESAQANLLGQEDVRRGVMLTLVSDLAAGYYQLIELDRELEIANESVATYKKTLDLFTDRYKAGKDSELPVTRTEGLYNASIANVSILKRKIEQQENALSVLAGLSPAPIARGRPLVAQQLPPTPLGATTELLRRRPDILQAEQGMISANAEVGVAVANFYPTLGLSALVGGQGVGIAGALHGFSLWSAGMNLVGPIFTGGRLEAQYRERQAFWDETVAEYRKTILTAFQETSDALVAQKTLVDQRENLELQVKALRHSVDLALLRYDNGRSTYFEVLEAEQQLYPAEYDLSQTQRDQFIAVVNLYKALGGGWTAGHDESVKEAAHNQPVKQAAHDEPMKEAAHTPHVSGPVVAEGP
jgi:multidrug efflux system outer membrane protein